MPRRTDCRICGSKDLHLFLDLGLSPLANRFLERDQLNEEEPIFPLDVFFCRDCTLVQLREVVDPEVLFRNYLYVSGTSETMRKHFHSLAKSLVSRFGLGAGDLVVDIASNDGTLLHGFDATKVEVLGIEPAANIAEIARESGIPTVNEFFSREVGQKVRKEHGPAACVMATNVFAHLDDMHDFADGLLELLGPEGIFVFENSYIVDTLENLEFDSVYHEHLSFFSVTALTRFFEMHGMEIFDVEHQPVHGGSLRVFVKRSSGSWPVTDAPADFRRREAEGGYTDAARYDRFGQAVLALREQLTALLTDLKGQGKRIVAYGASAKGQTLLNFLQLDRSVLDYIVDKSPLKQGRFSPGMHLPVFGPEKLLEDAPDYALLLAWNFRDEVIRQQKEFVEGGGRFIMPIPQPAVVPTAT